MTPDQVRRELDAIVREIEMGQKLCVLWVFIAFAIWIWGVL